MRIFATISLATVLAISMASSASASERAPGAFPAQLTDGTTTLDLCSTGLVRRLLLRALEAGLYLESCGAPDRALDDVPKALEITYFWSIGGSDFARAGDDVLTRAYTLAELAPLRERIDRLHAAYRDVAPGDRYRLTYVPGVGTTLALNGMPLVTIPGADFARVYFSIWLGDRPADEGLRTALLGSPASRTDG